MAGDYPALCWSDWRGTGLNLNFSYFFAFLTVFRGAEVFLTAGLAFTACALGTSPITDLTGHTLKTGHFLQPTAMAMGHRVIVNFR